MMAIVSATLQHNHAEASAMADELHAAEARFGLVVAAQFLTDAVRTISSSEVGTTADEVWQEFCIRADQAIERAASRTLRAE
jgi:hypothetical protein